MATSIHDKIITAIQGVLSPNMEIRLLGRVADPVIGNNSESEAFFFIPDLHLISPEKQHNFGDYVFNYADEKILESVLIKLAELKEDIEVNDGCKLITVQLGDFFDMWRENPGSEGSDAVDDETYGGLRDMLYRNQYRNGTCLKATMILGNHDTDLGEPLREIGFQFKAFNRTSDDTPFLFVTHGDAFDILEIIVPEPIKEFAVRFAGKATPVNPYPVGEWGKWASKTNKPLQDLKYSIMGPEHDVDMLPVGAPLVTSGKELPALLCWSLSKAADFSRIDDAHRGFFEKIYNALAISKEQGLAGKYVNVAVMGHTHQAATILYKPDNGDRPLLLMDIGAWIEKCQYPLEETPGKPIVEPSAQIGVIHGNDARIYQIRPVSPPH